VAPDEHGYAAKRLREEENAEVERLEREELEARLDRTVEETFPASDPPSSLPG
jgi:hypothetical protein